MICTITTPLPHLMYLPDEIISEIIEKVEYESEKFWGIFPAKLYVKKCVAMMNKRMKKLAVKVVDKLNYMSWQFRMNWASEMVYWKGEPVDENDMPYIMTKKGQLKLRENYVTNSKNYK